MSDSNVSDLSLNVLITTKEQSELEILLNQMIKEELYKAHCHYEELQTTMNQLKKANHTDACDLGNQLNYLKRLVKAAGVNVDVRAMMRAHIDGWKGDPGEPQSEALQYIDDFVREDPASLPPRLLKRLEKLADLVREDADRTYEKGRENRKREMLEKW
ncbi:hypothetical protein BDV96DRAFT_649812 [Lophiotrema nucula]|uniref:Uncharacterized protein n=1 Tax=Lophiotrema nucula TaxID=690887 RepID=A0A6A5Z0H9_9PLEO|nr:hypothetical protein BDV96DRAFT_649812 [Lophiotrema nucula]